MAFLHAFKVFLISTVTGVLFIALRLKGVTHVFLTWNLCLSYFKPHPHPYLFLFFNAIIISIAVSTMFHHRSHPTSPPAYVAKPMRLSIKEEEEEELLELEEELELELLEEEEEDPPLERTETPPAPALEDVWKAITEGRETKASKKLETFNERRERNKLVCSMSMRIAPSPSLDELNRHVEAFIRKFYEEIRLQKLQSLAESEHEDRWW